MEINSLLEKTENTIKPDTQENKQMDHKLNQPNVPEAQMTRLKSSYFGYYVNT